MATIKFSEFDTGNINSAGAEIVGLEAGVNKKFTASDLVNGYATVSYVDAQDNNLSLSISALSTTVTNNAGNITILQGNIVTLQSEIANIVDTDQQTLSWDGTTANLTISNGNSVILQEILDNAGAISLLQTSVSNLITDVNNIDANVDSNSANITVLQNNVSVIETQISDLQANGNIQLLSLDNTSNVLSISAGNSVDFTTILANVNVDAQTLTWDSGNSNLSISGGNTVTIDTGPTFYNIESSSAGGTGTSDANVLSWLGCPAASTVIDRVWKLKHNTDDGKVYGLVSYTNASGPVIPLTQYGFGGFTEGFFYTLNNLTSCAAHGSYFPVIVESRDSFASVEDIPPIVYASDTIGLSYIGAEYQATWYLEDIEIGLGSSAGSAAVSIGKDSNASGSRAVAIGEQAEAISTSGIAIGLDATTNTGISIGEYSDAYGRSIAIGSSAGGGSTGGADNILMGYGAGFNSGTPSYALHLNATGSVSTIEENGHLYISTSHTTIESNTSAGIQFTDSINGAVPLSSLVSGSSQVLSWDEANANLTISGGNTITLTGTTFSASVEDFTEGSDQGVKLSKNAYVTNGISNGIGSRLFFGTQSEFDFSATGYILATGGSAKQPLAGLQYAPDGNGYGMALLGWNSAFVSTRYSGSKWGYQSLDHVCAINGAQAHHTFKFDSTEALVLDYADDEARLNLNLDMADHSITSGNIIPSANVTYDLGSATARWNDLYLSGNSIFLGNQVISATGGGLDVSIDTLSGNSSVITLASSLIPDTNAQYDLGSAEFKIRHLYLSQNSLFVGNLAISAESNVSTSPGGMAVSTNVASSTLDLEKTVHVLADGTYTLNDGVEGQIIHLTPAVGSNSGLIILNVDNRTSWAGTFPLETVISGAITGWTPFLDASPSTLVTLIFTNGSWNYS